MGLISTRKATGARRGMVLVAGMAAAGALLAGTGPAGAAGDQAGGGPAPFFASGTCDREKPMMRRALDRSRLRVDVDGDGRLDRVATVTDHSAGKACRAFVGVRVRGGASYSLPLDRTAVPPVGTRATVIGLPDLGTDPGAEIVVDTRVRTDAQLAQMFTLTRSGLKRVLLPAFEDGTMVVEGGGVTFPRGAGCTARGALILSMATLEGDQYQVTRHTYPVRGDSLRLRGPRMVSTYVQGDQLAAAFPEFGSRHFKPCTGKVLR